MRQVADPQQPCLPQQHLRPTIVAHSAAPPSPREHPRRMILRERGFSGGGEDDPHPPHSPPLPSQSATRFLGNSTPPETLPSAVPGHLPEPPLLPMNIRLPQSEPLAHPPAHLPFPQPLSRPQIPQANELQPQPQPQSLSNPQHQSQHQPQHHQHPHRPLQPCQPQPHPQPSPHSGLYCRPLVLQRQSLPEVQPFCPHLPQPQPRPQPQLLLQPGQQALDLPGLAGPGGGTRQVLPPGPRLLMHPGTPWSLSPRSLQDLDPQPLPPSRPGPCTPPAGGGVLGFRGSGSGSAAQPQPLPSPPRERNCSGSKPRASVALPEDGHSWLKYGEKQLVCPSRTRAYFRCAQWRIGGCKAKKTVDFNAHNPVGILPTVKYTDSHNHAPALVTDEPPQLLSATPPAASGTLAGRHIVTAPIRGQVTKEPCLLSAPHGHQAHKAEKNQEPDLPAHGGTTVGSQDVIGHALSAAGAGAAASGPAGASAGTGDPQRNLLPSSQTCSPFFMAAPQLVTVDGSVKAEGCACTKLHIPVTTSTPQHAGITWQSQSGTPSLLEAGSMTFPLQANALHPVNPYPSTPTESQVGGQCLGPCCRELACGTTIQMKNDHSIMTHIQRHRIPPLPTEVATSHVGNAIHEASRDSYHGGHAPWQGLNSLAQSCPATGPLPQHSQNPYSPFPIQMQNPACREQVVCSSCTHGLAASCPCIPPTAPAPRDSLALPFSCQQGCLCNSRVAKIGSNSSFPTEGPFCAATVSRPSLQTPYVVALEQPRECSPSMQELPALAPVFIAAPDKDALSPGLSTFQNSSATPPRTGLNAMACTSTSPSQTMGGLRGHLQSTPPRTEEGCHSNQPRQVLDPGWPGADVGACDNQGTRCAKAECTFPDATLSQGLCLALLGRTLPFAAPPTVASCVQSTSMCNEDSHTFQELSQEQTALVKQCRGGWMGDPGNEIEGALWAEEKSAASTTTTQVSETMSPSPTSISGSEALLSAPAPGTSKDTTSACLGKRKQAERVHVASATSAEGRDDVVISALSSPTCKAPEHPQELQVGEIRSYSGLEINGCSDTDEDLTGDIFPYIDTRSSTIDRMVPIQPLAHGCSSGNILAELESVAEDPFASLTMPGPTDCNVPSDALTC